MIQKLLARLRSEPTARSGKSGAQAYAVGDVHGCLVQLETLLDRIGRDIDASPTCPTYLVFLGDLIDRGPDSCGVIERVMTYERPGVRTICLMGNHEEFLLRSLDGEPGVIHDWLEYGGRQLVDSYGQSGSLLATMPEDHAIAALRSIVPDTHRRFVQGFADSFQFGDFLFVHAGIRPGVALAKQQPADLRWIREPFLSDAADHGAMIVHGHTITRSVTTLPNRIGIDTGAYESGILTAIAIRQDDIRYLQTSGVEPTLCRSSSMPAE